MVDRIWLFTIILIIPIIGFMVSEGIQQHYNSHLRSVILEQSPNPNQIKINEVTLDNICENYANGYPEDLKEICSVNDKLNLLSSASIGLGVIGLLFLLCIHIAGYVSRDNRRLILLIFKPGLYLTSLALILIVIFHAAVLISSIYFLEAALTGRIHVYLLGIIGLGALAGVYVLASNTISIVSNSQTTVMGKVISKSEGPELWDRINAIADKLNTLKPHNIVLGLDPNFFVTEVDVVCFSGDCSGRTLYCSLPLMRILNNKEFDGIVGHELGHYKGLDTKFSKKFFPIYRGTYNAICELKGSAKNGFFAKIALLPAIAILSYFLESFSVAESKISRDRELIADSEGVQASDSKSFASALLKLHAFPFIWKDIQNTAVNAIQQDRIIVNISKTYSEIVRDQANPEAFYGLKDNRLTHPTDSHPSLGVRLDSMDIPINKVEKEALDVSPVSKAIKLVRDIEKLEEEISIVYQTIVAHHLGIDLNTKFENQQPDNS